MEIECNRHLYSTRLQIGSSERVDDLFDSLELISESRGARRGTSMTRADSSSPKLVRLPDGQTFDLGRLRSDGPLDAAELAFCREHDVPIGYDPAQIGWVTISCLDDLGEISAELEANEGIGVAAARSMAERRFEKGARQLLESHRTGQLAREAVENRLWALPEEVGRELPREARRASIRALQRAANALINTHVISEDERENRRQRALMAGDRKVLRPWAETDLADYRSLLDDPRVWRHLPGEYPDPLSDEEARGLITISNASDHHEVRAIEQAGQLVGQIRLLFLANRVVPGGARESAGETEPSEAEISYWLGQRYWGQRIIGDALPFYTYLSFRKHGALESIFARVADDNTASSKALLSAGYREEGWTAADLDGEPDIATYRCYRADYFPASKRLASESELARADGSGGDRAQRTPTTSAAD
jgi:RimJ/RimL family protein N-acetyltransferase